MDLQTLEGQGKKIHIYRCIYISERKQQGQEEQQKRILTWSSIEV